MPPPLLPSLSGTTTAMNRPLPPPTAQLRVKPLPLIDPCALLRMVLSEGGPCSVCECTSTHKWYGGVRKPFRCKQCYETEAKASKTPAFGTLVFAQAAEVARGVQLGVRRARGQHALANSRGPRAEVRIYPPPPCSPHTRPPTPAHRPRPLPPLKLRWRYSPTYGHACSPHIRHTCPPHPPTRPPAWPTLPPALRPPTTTCIPTHLPCLWLHRLIAYLVCSQVL